MANLDGPGRRRGVLATLAIAIVGAVVGIAALEGYRYVAVREADPEPAQADLANAQETAPEQHATADPREDLIQTVAYQVAAERGESYPTEQIYSDVRSHLSRLETGFPQSTPADFREAYRVMSSARFYYPELTLDQITQMLLQDAQNSGGKIDAAADDLFTQIQYEYFRPQVEALQAKEDYNQRTHETIQANLQAIRERGEAANAARQAALANMGRRTPMEQRWFNDYLASFPRGYVVDVPTVRPNQVRPNQVRPPQVRPPQVRPPQVRPPQVRPPQVRPPQVRPIPVQPRY